MSLKRIFLAATLFVLLGLPANAIDQPDLTDGFTPPEIAAGGILGGFPLGNLDSINPYSGKASISIPIRTVAGRGDGSHTLVVPAGYTWIVNKEDSCPSWNENCSNPDIYNNPEEQSPNILAGAIHPGTVVGRLAVTWSYTYCNGVPSRFINTTITRFTLNGGLTLRDKLTNGKPQVLTGGAGCYSTYANYSRGYEFVAADGSGITFISDTEIFDKKDPEDQIKPDGWLYYPDGRRVRVDDGVYQKIVDRNGNETVFTYTSGRLTKVTDSLNRETVITYDQTCNSIYDCDVITWKGANGATRTAEVWYDDLADVLDTGYSITSYASLFPDLSTNLGATQFNVARAVWRVVLPDDRYYEFFYNSYGEVTKAILPTGARIEWDWTTGTGTGGGANADDDVVLRRVTERRAYLDATTSTVATKTTYAYEVQTDCQPLSTLAGWKTTVTVWDGASVATKSANYYCGVPGENGYNGPYDYPSWKNGRSYKTEELDGSTVKQRQVTTWKQYPLTGSLKWWSGDAEDDAAPVERPRIDTTETINLEGSSMTAKRTFKYDQYNNRTDTFEYDWNASTPLRRTHIVYETGSSYVDAPVHLRSLPLKQWICGAGTGDCTEGAAVAKTEYVYDGETLTSRSNASGHDTTNFGTSHTTRGLLTKVRRWRNLPMSTWIESVVKYDILGNPIQTIDPRGNSTTLSYTDDFSNSSTPELGSESTYAFATTATNALSQSVSTEVDYYLSRPTTFSDLNGVDMLYEFNDTLDRPTKVIEANNHASVKRQTTFSYLVPNGSNIHTYNIEFRRDLSTFADGGLYSRTFYDRLGRKVAAQRDDCSMSVTTYDGAGRAKTVSNPKIHESGTPGYCQGYVTWPGGQPVTTTNYDYAGRVNEVVRPGSADSDTSYLGNRMRIEDAAGKKRDLYYDALGRLVLVVEDPTGSLNYVTEYTYNEIDKLTQVTQKGTGGTGTQQTRSFTYDSLGRMLSADNPEDTGSINYAYDDNSNLLRKVDARGVAKCFYSNQTCSSGGTLGTDGYDALNRVAVITYSDSTPTERFCYDGKVYDTSSSACVTPGTSIPYSVGRLTSQGSAGISATTFNSFDQLGRVLASEQKTHTGSTYETYTFSYAYNRNGALTSQTYPSGHTVTFTYDGSGRPYSAQESGGGSSYLNSVAYTAHGAIDNLQLGNSLVEQTCYNDLSQPITRRLGDTTSTVCAVQGADLLHLSFDYGAAANNGNMLQQTIWASDNGSGSPWSVTQDYTYDAVNRLATASEVLNSVQQWSRTYSYDHFGNRWLSGATGHTLHMATPTSQAAIQATTNRLTGTGITYDNAGNLTAHPYITPGSGSMIYDANNKMAAFTASGVSVATKYDAAGRRVRKTYNSQTTIWVYDAFSKLAAEYTTESQAVAAGTYYRTTDHLGSTRLTTDDDGDVVSRRDFFPFGEQIDSTLSGRGSVTDGGFASFNFNPGMRQQFTGQQRDNETGLDYFWARHYQPPLGTFTSIDPSNIGADPANPQLWNGFGYVGASPHNYTDPDGTERCVTTEDGRQQCTPDPSPSLIWVPSSLTGEESNEMALQWCWNIFSAAGSGAFAQLSWSSECSSFFYPGTDLYNAALLASMFGNSEGCTANMYISGNCWDPDEDSDLFVTAAGVARLPPIGYATWAAYMAVIRGLGVLGERAVAAITGLTKNNGQFLKIADTLSGKMRIPDFYDKTNRIIYEVKNASSVSWTSQLDDMSQWALRNGHTFVLYIREGVRSAGGLSDKILEMERLGLVQILEFTY